jgi:hypothetical protein
MSEDKLEKVLKKIQIFLGKLIANNKDKLTKDNGFLVNTSIAYGLFRLGKIDGSYNESLQGLIHHYRYEKKIYHKILDKDKLKNVSKIVRDNPEFIYHPDGEDQSDLMDEIYWQCIAFVGKKLTSMGHKLDSEFEEYLQD